MVGRAKLIVCVKINRLLPHQCWWTFDICAAGGTWKWTKGRSEYRKWAQNEPGNNGDCVSISSLSKLMSTQSCSARFPLLCYSDNVVLVKENKTWEEAQERCRALNAQYELVSVVPGAEHNFVMTKVPPANTEEVGSSYSSTCVWKIDLRTIC